MRGVRRGGRLVDRQHRAGRHAVADQPQRQFVAVLLGERRRQHLGQRHAVDVALAVVGEARIVGQLRPAEHFAQLAELPVVAAGDEDVAGPGRELVVGREVRMRIAGAGRALAVQEVVRRLRMQQRHAAVVQRHVDELALARTSCARAAPSGCRSQAYRPVAMSTIGVPRRIGPVVGVAVDGHQAGHRLQHRVVARQAAERPVGAEAGDAAMDQARETASTASS